MKLKNLFNFSSVTLFLFMFLGYLEAGPLGVLSGFFFWAFNSLLIPFSLVPFGGFLFYKWACDAILSNIAKFMPVPTLFEKAWLIFGIQALLYNICSSVAIVALIAILLWYWYKHKKPQIKLQALPFETFYRELINLDNLSFKDFLSSIITKLKKALEKLDRDLIGSCIFWLGIGIASHDFYWETGEDIVHVERYTHGVYLGLGLASTGINLIELSLSRNLLFYLGQGLCYLGFYSLSFLPRGLSRLISHFFWWAGVSLMIYNWYKLVEDKLFKGEIDSKKVGELLNVHKRNS